MSNGIDKGLLLILSKFFGVEKYFEQFDWIHMISHPMHRIVFVHFFPTQVTSQRNSSMKKLKSICTHTLFFKDANILFVFSQNSWIEKDTFYIGPVARDLLQRDCFQFNFGSWVWYFHCLEKKKFVIFCWPIFGMTNFI